MKGFYRYLAMLSLVLLAGCIERYSPEVKDVGTNFLVVDGFINPVGVTTIRLSRTTGLQNTKPIPVESRATVYIEEEGGTRYPLTESPTGTYTSASLRLPAGRRVRLYIKTNGPKEYVSDYTSVKITPAIDSVYWRPQARGLQVYVASHDGTDQTRNYRWEFDETWELTVPVYSLLEFRNNRIEQRVTNIYRCWASNKSSNIILGNTNRLSRDVLIDGPVTTVPANSDKLFIKYSILVRQYALTPAESDYWETLSKNTENLGTVFGPTPVQLTGNVRCLNNAEELVMGFVGAQSVTEKRLFVDNSELPREWRQFRDNLQCQFFDTIPNPRTMRPTPAEHFASGLLGIPVREWKPGVFLSSSRECADCRLRGSNIRPSFWQ